MWILHFFANESIEYIVNALLLVGIVSCFLSFFIINKLMVLFPPLVAYYKLLQVVSVVLLLSGVYFKGVYHAELEWREKVAEVELKLIAAYAKTDMVNTAITATVKNKRVMIKEKTKTLIEYVDREVIKLDNTCIIPNTVFDIHNQAASIIDNGVNKK